jgi:acyl CoA:acetate/3-ketoacid CoA transferase alpha subunit/acyl CoA:acetate/3-ketoacid CoA transferase beta subunit
MSKDVSRELHEWLERRFAVPTPTTDKVRTLSEAVADGVKPGDALHLGMTHTRGSAGVWEVLRQFHGADPGFTLLGVQVSSGYSPLVHAGLARKIVTSWAGDSYYTPGPNGAYQRAWANGVEFEHWSILTFAQRLAAGARGLAWTTTRSLAGSSMETDNADNVRRMEDGTVAIRALVPDVSIYHAPAADAQGNVLVAPPLMENLSGALAARRGAIVTVDKIVDADTVREHAHLVRVPASAVRAVVEAPLGGHPGGLRPSGIPGVEGYGEDYEFWVDIRRAAKDPGAMDAWIKEWVLDADTHERYLERLGSDRIAKLRTRADPGSWRQELDAMLPSLDLDAPPNAIETAIVAASRALKDRVKGVGATAMLAGAGMANLAAWLAAYDLAEEGVIVDLVAEMGLVGYWPRPGEPMLFNQRNFPSCTMLADIDTTLAIIIGGGTARSVGSLGAAQVDKHGNINSTVIPGETLLMGSGGANDVATCATESVVVVSQLKERFLDKVPYITGPGDRVTRLVSTLGVYEKDQGEFVLTAVFDKDTTAAAKECVERCGWDLRVARTVTTLDPPTTEEIRTLRVFDPNGWFRE